MAKVVIEATHMPLFYAPANKSHQQLGWLSIFVWSLMTIAFWSIGLRFLAPFFLLLVGSGVYLLLVVGPIEIGADSIVQNTLLSRREMRWDEILRVETQSQTEIVLHSLERRLVIPGPNAWEGAHRDSMVEFFEAILEAHGLKSDSHAKSWERQGLVLN